MNFTPNGGDVFGTMRNYTFAQRQTNGLTGCLESGSNPWTVAYLRVREEGDGGAVAIHLFLFLP